MEAQKLQKSNPNEPVMTEWYSLISQMLRMGLLPREVARVMGVKTREIVRLKLKLKK